MNLGAITLLPPPPPPPLPPRSSLSPGFRFHPTDEDLLRYYLTRKVCGKPFQFQPVMEMDVYKYDPWELADYSQLNIRDQELYFFSPVDKKYGNCSRLNRVTRQGYWKVTGKERLVRLKAQTIGSKRMLIFHVGRGPDSKRTDWVMHEYRLSDRDLERAKVSQDTFVLCKIFQNTVLGPPTGERDAPVAEEEWKDDGALFVPRVQVDGIRNDTVQMDHQKIDFLSIRIRSEDNNGSKSDPELETFSLANKRSKKSHPAHFCHQPTANKEAHPLTASPPSFDGSTLEKSVPPGFLKLIDNLETKIMKLTMEKETLKIEMKRAQAMIDDLVSNINHLAKENNRLKSGA